jgi:hypothetical protein
MGQEEPKASRRVQGRWGWRGRGHSDHQLLQRKRAGEQRAAAVGGQVVAVVCGVEEHDQRTAVVVADLLTDRTPVLSGNVDNDHIGRRSTPGQLQRCLDHVDGAILTEQSEQLDARPHASIQQGHALRALWYWHLSSLGGLATSGYRSKWSALHRALPGDQALHAQRRAASPGDGTFGVLVVLDPAVVLAGCLKVEHGRLLGRPSGHW